MEEDFLCPLVFRPYHVGSHGVGCNCWFIRLEQRAEAVEGDSGVGCLVVGPGDDEARVIVTPWEFNGLEEVDKDLAEAFKVVVGCFSCYGQ